MNISVVIPAYNAGRTLDAAIRSCLEQSVAAYEIIVVDDASTDDTVQIASAYPQVTLLRQPVNAGPSAARNRGWNAAKGAIVAFLDGDDVWHAEKLVIITKLFQQKPEISLLGHSYVLQEFPPVLPAAHTEERSYTGILLKNPYQPSCMAIRKKVLERFDESYRYCEDHELAIRMAHKQPVHFIDLPLTRLGRPQLSSGGASGNKWKMRKGELRLYSSIYRHRIWYAAFIPLLWIFSMAKMLYKTVSR